MAKSNRHNAPTPLAQWTPTVRETPTAKTVVTGKRVVRKTDSCKFDLLEEYDLTMVEVRTILGGLGYPRAQQTLVKYFEEYGFRKPVRHLPKLGTKRVKRSVNVSKKSVMTSSKTKVTPTTAQRQYVAEKLGSASNLSDNMIVVLYNKLMSL